MFAVVRMVGETPQFETKILESKEAALEESRVRNDTLDELRQEMKSVDRHGKIVFRVYELVPVAPC